jgi:hypothetical protein
MGGTPGPPTNPLLYVVGEEFPHLALRGERGLPCARSRLRLLDGLGATQDAAELYVPAATRQMSRAPAVAWSFAFPSGSATRPSTAIGLFQ